MDMTLEEKKEQLLEELKETEALIKEENKFSSEIIKLEDKFAIRINKGSKVYDSPALTMEELAKVISDVGKIFYTELDLNSIFKDMDQMFKDTFKIFRF